MNKSKHQLSAFWSLTCRHMLVFLKNIPTVIFTLMVPLAIFAIYILFLRPMETGQIKASLESLLPEVIANESLLHQFYSLADSWMIAGVLAVSCITVSLNTNYILVKDKENGINKDMVSSPIDSRVIVLSYFTFNFVVTFVMNFIVYCIAMVYLACYQLYMISVLDFFATVGVMLLSAISAALVTHFICNFINSDAVMAPIVAIFSAAIGFLIGAYLPGDMMPAGIQSLTGFFPGTYSAGLFRNYMMSTPIEKLLADPAMSSHVDEIKEVVHSFNIDISATNEVKVYIDFFGIHVDTGVMTLVLLGAIVVFLVLNLVISKKNNLFRFNRKEPKKAKVVEEKSEE